MSRNNISSEISKLDELTSYFRKSDLIILAARPAMGKTTLCLNIADKIISKNDNSVLFFSLDKSYKDLKERYKLNNEVSCFGENNNLDKSTLIIEDIKDATLEDIENKSSLICLKNKIALIIIDYLQLIKIDKSNEIDSRNKEISEILKRIKKLSIELNVPIICQAQLPRELEERQDKHPQLSDFLEQTCIEENSDTILFLYRDEYYNPSNSDSKGIAEVIIAKYYNKKDNICLNFDSKLCVNKIKD